jgi:branched-chain amino acid transport system ATP-binding protein
LDRDALAVRNLSTSYGTGRVLEAVSFRLAAGEVLALLGRNGAGKTTCIRTIIGFLPAETGSVDFFGDRISGLPSEAIARRGIGLVPQGRRIFTSLTVYENLVVAMRPPSQETGLSWNLERVYDLFPRLKERRNQIAGSLSGGEQQMLAIGRALMVNPRLLLLDEPSEGLAPAVINDIARTISVLKSQGLSMLLVEHNTKLALGIADKAVVLNSGLVVFDGSAEALVKDDDLISYHLGVY